MLEGRTPEWCGLFGIPQKEKAPKAPDWLSRPMPPGGATPIETIGEKVA